MPGRVAFTTHTCDRPDSRLSTAGALDRPLWRVDGTRLAGVSDPRSSRPSFPDPEEYGPPLEEASAPLNSWGGCSARLEASALYWLATTRRDGRPHVVPVGAVWVEDRLWFNTSRQTVIARILANEPRVVVHLESAEDVLIVEGLASRLDFAKVPADVVVAYTDKYGGDWDRGDPDSLWLWFALDPRSAMSWSYSDIRNTAIRYDFE